MREGDVGGLIEGIARCSGRAKIPARGVENNHRISAVATVKGEYFSPRVDGDCGNASELPARWQRILISIKAEIGLLVGRDRRADQLLQARIIPELPRMPAKSGLRADVLFGPTDIAA